MQALWNKLLADAGIDVRKLYFHYKKPMAGNHSVLCVGHMFDAPDRATPRFPKSNFGQAIVSYFRVLNTMHAKLPITSVITGGTHGGDSFAVWWALLNNVKLIIVRPYTEEDHLPARLPQDQGLLTLWYTNMEQIYQRAVADKRVTVLYPLQNGTNAILSKAETVAQGTNLGDSSLCYVATNISMLSVLSTATHREMIALWDGKGGDNPGGTEHAVRSARSRLHVVPVLLTAGLHNVNMPVDLQTFVTTA